MRKDDTLVALGATPCSECGSALGPDHKIYHYCGAAGTRDAPGLVPGNSYPFCSTCSPQIAKDMRWYSKRSVAAMMTKNATLVALGATACAACGHMLSTHDQTILLYIGPRHGFFPARGPGEHRRGPTQVYRGMLAPFCRGCVPEMEEYNCWTRLGT